MQYTAHYNSPLGEILLAADEIGLTGLWFVGQKYFALYLQKENAIAENCDSDQAKCTEQILDNAKRWLDVYFSGSEPDFMPPLHFMGTQFQNEVWEILAAIPYGKTTTYGEIAKTLAERCGKKTMSAQAVGGAVGHNEISIIVPCHRVIGANGNLTGYAGGIKKKIALLKIEGAFDEKFFVPKKSTAP